MAIDQKARPSLEDVLKFIESSPEASLKAFEEMQKRMDKRRPDLRLEIPEEFTGIVKGLYCKFKHEKDEKRSYEETQKCKAKCRELFGVDLYGDNWFRERERNLFIWAVGESSD
jgi:hypothetical protein